MVAWPRLGAGDGASAGAPVRIRGIDWGFLLILGVALAMLGFRAYSIWDGSGHQRSISEIKSGIVLVWAAGCLYATLRAVFFERGSRGSRLGLWLWSVGVFSLSLFAGGVLVAGLPLDFPPALIVAAVRDLQTGEGLRDGLVIAAGFGAYALFRLGLAAMFRTPEDKPTPKLRLDSL
jgi:hypothetical protein